MSNYKKRVENRNWIKKLRSYGNYFGYPKCCINDFVKMVIEDKTPGRIQEKVGEYTGFIPCSYCSWRILTKNVKLDDLIQNRTCNEPFRKYK